MDEYFRFKKQWQTEQIATIVWLLIVFVCYGIIFWTAVKTSFYWIKNDYLTIIQFNKYFWANYWYVIPVWLFACFGKFKYMDHATACKAFKRKWERLQNH